MYFPLLLLVVWSTLLGAFPVSVGAYFWDDQGAKDSTIEFTQYSHATGNYLSKLSASTYCTAAKLMRWTCPTCADKYIVEDSITALQEGDVEALVLVDVRPGAASNEGEAEPQSTIVVVFRGTDVLSWDNWLADLKFMGITPTQYSNCKGCSVHRGFLHAFESLQDKILSRVQDLMEQYPDASVVVTGHSLGGAMAVHCALTLLEMDKPAPLAALYTFGQPRTGNGVFANWATARLAAQGASYFRITNDQDPVPQLPPYFWDYQHFGTEIYYSSFSVVLGTSGPWHVCQGTGDSTCLESKSLVSSSVGDHCGYVDVNYCINWMKCSGEILPAIPTAKDFELGLDSLLTPGAAAEAAKSAWEKLGILVPSWGGQGDEELVHEGASLANTS
ncbi:unnamed protein product [Chrysoparadoxa australica]